MFYDSDAIVSFPIFIMIKYKKEIMHINFFDELFGSKKSK